MEIKEVQKRVEIFFNNDIRVFIRDIYNNFFFCEIREINKEWVVVYNFKGNRKGTKTRILWMDIKVVEEYRGFGE